MRILGIDPGLASTGVGVITDEGAEAGRWRVLAHDDVRTAAAVPMAERLAAIHRLVTETVAEYRPDVASVEAVFFAKNVRSAILMAHGRGVALLAAAQGGAEIREFSALEIKQSVVGKGRASKEQVMLMVRTLLDLEALPPSDHQADALACALAHAYRSRLVERLNAAGGVEANAGAKALLAQARRGRRRR
ncbi:MAG: crossover junction endodeoxyribonuclease RuvC [Sumerlaeia bacterium]